MLSPLKNVLEFTKEWSNLHESWKSFLQSLLRNQEALEKKRKRPTALAPPLKKSFVKPETFWNGMGWLLTTYDSCLWMQVLCTFFSSFQLSEVAERWAAAASKISPHVISALQIMSCQAAQWKIPGPGSGSLQKWQKPNRESGGTCGSNLDSSLAGNCRRQRKSSSYTSPRRATTERGEHTVHSIKVLTPPQLFSIYIQ